MPLSRIQKRRIYHVLATGKRKRASREQLLSAIVTHRTETNYGNPSGGHGSSSGWRQQISGAGVKSRNRQSIRKQAGYYFDEARGKRGTPGQISNAVQRSAYPQKASDPSINREAQKILAAFEAGRLGRVPGGGGGGRPGGGSREVTKTVTPGVDNSGVRRDAKLAYLSQRGNPDALLNLAASLRGAGDVPAVTKTSVVRTPGRRGRGGPKVSGGGGSAKQQARKLAAQAGRGYVTSGERTPQNNAAVGGAPGSDHLTTGPGSAVDMKYGTGRKVARRLGIKNWKPGTYQRYTVKIRGRRYSVQLLENVKGHYDHTHLGIKRI